MGLPESELYDLTFRQFQNKLTGFNELEDSRQQQNWERMRLQTAVIYNTSGFVKKAKTAKELFPMPWDIKEEVKVTKEEVIEKLKSKKWAV